MSYSLEAVLGAAPALRKSAEDLASARLVELAQGLALIPLTEELQKELGERFGSRADTTFRGLPFGSWAVNRWLHAISRGGRVVLVGAEFFGGIGTQWAIAMEAGRVVGTFEERLDAINRALRGLGVTADAGKDEFDTLGLGRFRRTERWAGESP